MTEFPLSCYAYFNLVNEILGDHNVDKQITDNKGDVCVLMLSKSLTINVSQVAYLMADISNVQPSEIKEISDSLEALSCKIFCSNRIFLLILI